MSRTINESIETLDTSLDTIKEKLSDKIPGGGLPSQIKVSEIPGYLDQIETGGGGLDWDNPKYISFEPKGPFYTYDVLESSFYSKEINVTFNNLDPKNNNYFFIISSNLKIEVADENSEYSGEWKSGNMIMVGPSQSVKKKIRFTGTDPFPVLLLTMNYSQGIEDIAKVDVRHS